MGTRRADPSALWNIVHGQCVPHEEGGEGSQPCVSIDLAGGEKDGVAILKDLVGEAQMLAIPTRRIRYLRKNCAQLLANTRRPVGNGLAAHRVEQAAV